MLKAFIILALVCSISSATVPVEKNLEGFNWEAIKCLITSEKLIDTFKQVIQLIKKFDFNEIIAFVFTNYAEVVAEVDKCFGKEISLESFNWQYQQCIRFYPQHFCSQYRQPEEEEDDDF